MDWSNERYVRIYTRDTETVLLQSWQARHIFREMCRKCDRAGVIECRTGVRGLAVILSMASDADVVANHLPQLLADGSVREVAVGYFLPNFVDAQEAPQSDKLRAKESRERRRDLHKAALVVTKRDAEPDQQAPVSERDTNSEPVTKRSVESRNERERHETNENVTPRHTLSLQPSQPVQPSKPASSNSSERTSAQRLVIAANQTFTSKFGEQSNPLTPQHGGTTDLVQRITEAGIPVDFAEQSVARQAGKLRNPVKTMAYFAPGIVDDWAKRNAKVDAANAPRVIPLTRNGQPEQTRPPRGGSPQAESDSTLCGICGTTETHLVGKRYVPKHKDGCALAVATQAIGH